MKDPLSTRWAAILLAVALLLVFAVSLAVSLALGAPAKLPGIALGSAMLLHLARAILVTAAVGALALVLLRGAWGHWPMEAGGVKYRQLETETGLVAQLDRMEKLLEAHEDALKDLEGGI